MSQLDQLSVDVNYFLIFKVVEKKVAPESATYSSTKPLKQEYVS